MVDALKPSALAQRLVDTLRRDGPAAAERIARESGEAPQHLVEALLPMLRGYEGAALGAWLLDLAPHLADSVVARAAAVAQPQVARYLLLHLCETGAVGLDTVLGLLTSDSPTIAAAAIACLAGFPSPENAALLEAHWAGPHRVDVALAWARMKQSRYTNHIVRALATADEDAAFDHLTVALESMGDSTASAELRRLMATVSPNRVRSLAITLEALDPPGPALDWQHPEYTERLRRWWADGTHPEPGIVDVESHGANILHVRSHGTGRIRFAYPAPFQKGNWARWSKVLYAGDRLLYRLSSDCPTCETVLSWCSADAPRAEADVVGKTLSDLPTLTPSCVAGLGPLLRQLASGLFLTALCELTLERVDAQQAVRSWYFRRMEHRLPDDPAWDEEYDSSQDTPENCWPRTSHFQHPERIAAEIPTAVTLLPTQDIDVFDEAVLDERRQAIRDGMRPAAVGIGWLESRCVTGSYSESFFQVVVLDGHHTLEAWRREGLPARIVLLCPLNRSWPHEELERILGQLTVKRSGD